MTAQSSKIYLTKLAAAQRQLSAAIRMYFSEEDELAVHTVASAAYRILRDLKAKDGRDEAADQCLSGIFYVVRDYRRNTLPDYIAHDSEMMRWVREMAESLPMISQSTNYEEVKLETSQDISQEFYRNTNFIANFLKHADNDSGAFLDLDNVDNLKLLMQASTAYSDVVKENLWPEGFVLWVYFNADQAMKAGMPAEFREYASDLEDISPDQRKVVCLRWLQELKSARASTPPSPPPGPHPA